MAFEFITNLIGTSPKVWSTATTTAVTQISARLAAETEVRIFVDNSINFGHQSCSVLLMKQLIDTYGFTGVGKTITMTYPAYDYVNTLKKLALLIPGLDPGGNQPTEPPYQPAPIQNYGNSGVTIAFTTVEALPDVQINYGFTAGADDGAGRDTLNWFAINLRVNLFLRLQTYQRPGVQQVQYGGVNQGTPPYDLTSVTAFGWPFNYRAWYIPDAYWIPTMADWTYYTTSPDVSENSRYHTSLAQELVRFITANPDSLRLMPVYGIKSQQGQVGMPPDKLLPTIISTALGGGYLDPAHQPAVVVSMNNDLTDEQYNMSLNVCHGLRTSDEILALNAFNEAREAELSARNTLQTAIAGADLDQLQQNLNEATANLASAQRRNNMQTAGWESRVAWLTPRNAGLGVRFVSSVPRNGNAAVTDEQLAADLATLIDPLQTPRPAVLFLELGALPPLIFNYLMSLATYPNVFEGANSNNLALNQGGSYLRMKNNYGLPYENNVRYPQCWYSSRYNSYTKSAMESLAAANGVTSALEQNLFSAANFVPNITITTNYLNHFYFSADNTLRTYYTQNQAYYHNPNNDKLMLG
ncbi:MAG TPA: hypothetical protein VIE65_08035, partial [Methylobacter sp.]